MKNRKKVLIILIIIVSVIIMCWLAIFTTDFIRSNSLKPPIFAFAEITADDGGSGNYQGLGYNVEVKKRMDADYGVQIVSIKMYMFGRLIAASTK